MRGNGLLGKVRGRALLAGALLLALQSSGWALINKQITPTDLVKGATQVAVLELAAPKDNKIAVKTSEVLKGDKLPPRAAVIDISDTPEATLAEFNEILGANPATPALVMTSRLGAEPGAKSPAALLCVGTKWFALFAEKDCYRLDKDPKDIDAVWAGGARTMALVARAVIQDPTLDFPVDARLKWTNPVKIADMAGGVNGTLPVDLGPKAGRGVLVLATGGDRFIQSGTGANPTDGTAKLKLTTTSKLAALGAYTGTGRLDIMSWDGTALCLAQQAEDGTFSLKKLPVTLADVVSLAALDVGDAKRAGLLVGTTKGPVVLVPDGDAAWKQVALAIPADALQALGAGGICTVADFTSDGLPDIVAVYSKGYVSFTATKPGQFQAGEKCLLELVDTPSSVLVGDFDTDGKLDLIVSGGNGSVLLAGGTVSQLKDRTVESAELAYHGNLNAPKVQTSIMWDVNNDGRQGFSLFYATLAPKHFFNRNFACFGFGRELTLDDPALAAVGTLQEGAQAGTVADLNGDATPDLVAVDNAGAVWMLGGEAAKDRSKAGVDVSLPAGVAGPVTYRVTNGKRLCGIYTLRAGEVQHLGGRSGNTLLLDWQDTAGQKRTLELPLKDQTQPVVLQAK